MNVPTAMASAIVDSVMGLNGNHKHDARIAVGSGLKFVEEAVPSSWGSAIGPFSEWRGLVAATEGYLSLIHI